jgi:hypothetical protein
MPDWTLQSWSVINSDAEGISAVLAVLVALAGLSKWFFRKRSEEKRPMLEARGGKGGDASVGGNGTAIGGRGGRGGLAGIGGDGGGGHVAGDGMAMGGDGGDAGTPWRPALGAPSPMERMAELGMSAWPEAERDEFGFFVVGRGGSGGDIGHGCRWVDIAIHSCLSPSCSGFGPPMCLTEPTKPDLTGPNPSGTPSPDWIRR